MTEEELKAIEVRVAERTRLHSADCCGHDDERALVAEVRRLRLVADAATCAVNEGWIDLDDIERKAGPAAAAALLKACE